MTELDETDSENGEQVLREKLILAHKILLASGVLQQNLGHASIRLQGKKQILIMGHLHDVGKTFDMAKTEDLSVMDLDGNHIGGQLEPPGERYNHTGIYNVRPEINAVVHCHPIISTAFTIANRDIIPVGRFGGCFHPKVPVYQKSIQVETPEIGAEIAETLGDAPAVMLKHHGAACVGKTIEQAVAVAITLEDTARFLHIAHNLGTPEPLPLEEIDTDRALKLDRPSFSSNPWTYWAEQVTKEQ